MADADEAIPLLCGKEFTRIRGGTSINANNEPLYVIDGFPIEVDYSSGTLQL